MKSYTAPTQADSGEQAQLTKTAKDLEQRLAALEDLVILQQQQIQVQSQQIQELTLRQETTDNITQVLRQDVNILIPMIDAVNYLIYNVERLLVDTENIAEQLQVNDNRVTDLEGETTLQAQTIQQHTGNIASLNSSVSVLGDDQDEMKQVLSTNLAILFSYTVMQIGIVSAAFSIFSTEMAYRMQENQDMASYYSYPTGQAYRDEELEDNGYKEMDHEHLMAALRRANFPQDITKNNSFDFQVEMYDAFLPNIFKLCNIGGTHPWKVATSIYREDSTIRGFLPGWL